MNLCDSTILFRPGILLRILKIETSLPEDRVEVISAAALDEPLQVVNASSHSSVDETPVMHDSPML